MVSLLLSVIAGFFQSPARKQNQAEAGRGEFRSLMLKTVRCETSKKYKQLWEALNKEIVWEPILPSSIPGLLLAVDETKCRPGIEDAILLNRYKVKVTDQYITTPPELVMLIDQIELEAALADEGAEEVLEIEDEDYNEMSMLLE